MQGGCNFAFEIHNCAVAVRNIKRSFKADAPRAHQADGLANRDVVSQVLLARGVGARALTMKASQASMSSKKEPSPFIEITAIQIEKDSVL